MESSVALQIVELPIHFFGAYGLVLMALIVGIVWVIKELAAERAYSRETLKQYHEMYHQDVVNLTESVGKLSHGIELLSERVKNQ